MHNGDLGPRQAIWSTKEPVTILGALKNAKGAQEVRDTFHWLEGMFSDCTGYSFEIVAAEVIGDVAYTAGFEHVQTSLKGQPRDFVLRATQIYRREDGEWKVAPTGTRTRSRLLRGTVPWESVASELRRTLGPTGTRASSGPWVPPPVCRF